MVLDTSGSSPTGTKRKAEADTMTHRRFWIYFLLFLFNVICYLDRINMSVAGRSIAGEFGLSPVALGYLFSSFLWAYVLMMLPGGADDRQSWSPSRGGDLCDHLVDRANSQRHRDRFRY